MSRVPNPDSLQIALVLTASTGGIGRHVASVAARMQAAGHRVRVFCPESTAQAQGFAALGLEVRPLRRLPRATGADVVHAHGYKAGGLARPVARFIGAPLVVTWHNAVLGSGAGARAARLLQRSVARGADLTLGVSSDLEAQARALGARRVALAPVAAPALPAPRHAREVQRRALGAEPEDTVILTVTRLAPQKNLGLVLDIAAAVRDRADLRFVIAGDGPLLGDLQARVTADGSRVSFLGRRDDIASLLGAADLALLTSTWEARALVAQEALLAGLPLISTRVGGIPELVGDAAILVELGDGPEATRQLVRVADDPALRERLRVAGKQRAARWPSEDEVAEDLLACYRGLVQRAIDRAR